jgi:hypothetical protein
MSSGTYLDQLVHPLATPIGVDGQAADLPAHLCYPTGTPIAPTALCSVAAG